MTKVIFIVPICAAQRAVLRMDRDWKPGAAVWVDRDQCMIANCEESEAEPCRLCA